MPDGRTVDQVRDLLVLDRVYTVRLSASTHTEEHDDEEDSPQPGQPGPLSVSTHDGNVAVMLDRALCNDSTDVEALLVAFYQPANADIKVDTTTDAAALRSFAAEVSERVLLPRLEALAQALRGFVGFMPRLPDDAVEATILPINRVSGPPEIGADGAGS